MTNPQKEKLREQYIQYMLYIKTSGIHGAELEKAMSDFWLAKFDELLAGTAEEIRKLKKDPKKVTYADDPYESENFNEGVEAAANLVEGKE